MTGEINFAVRQRMLTDSDPLRDRDVIIQLCEEREFASVIEGQLGLAGICGELWVQRSHSINSPLHLAISSDAVLVAGEFAQAHRAAGVEFVG